MVSSELIARCYTLRNMIENDSEILRSGLRGDILDEYTMLTGEELECMDGIIQMLNRMEMQND